MRYTHRELFPWWKHTNQSLSTNSSRWREKRSSRSSWRTSLPSRRSSGFQNKSNIVIENISVFRDRSNSTTDRREERNPWKIHFLHAPTRHLKFIATNWKVFSQFEGVSAHQHATDLSWKGDFHLSVHYSPIFLTSQTKADRQFGENENTHRIFLRAWGSSYLWWGRFSAFLREEKTTICLLIWLFAFPRLLFFPSCPITMITNRKRERKKEQRRELESFIFDVFQTRVSHFSRCEEQLIEEWTSSSVCSVLEDSTACHLIALSSLRWSSLNFDVWFEWLSRISKYFHE